MHQLNKQTRGNFLALLLTLPLLFTGCGKTSNYGYPSNVNFSNEGGSKEIKGNESPYLLGIADDEGDGEAVHIQQPGDSMNVTYQWLTIKAKKGEHKFTLIAQPKQGGTGRTLRVYAGTDPTGGILPHYTTNQAHSLCAENSWNPWRGYARMA